MNNVAKFADYRRPTTSEDIDLSKCMVKHENVHFLKRRVPVPVQQHESVPYHKVVGGLMVVCTTVAVGATLLGIN